MRYIIWDERDDGYVYPEECDSKKKAIRKADQVWKNWITDEDKKHIVAFYVMESDNPDEDSPNHYDGNDIKRYK